MADGVQPCGPGAGYGMVEAPDIVETISKRSGS